MRRAASVSPGPTFTVARRRRRFGLDAPRPPDVGRVEAEILAWLGSRIPDVLPFRIEHAGGTASPRTTSALVLLLPGGRAAVLRIDLKSDRIGAVATALAESCKTRRIPLAVVADVDDARAALRRLGLEPREA